MKFELICFILLILFVYAIECDYNQEDFVYQNIYIINLKRSIDRREKMEKKLKILNNIIPYSFFEAFDGMKLTKEWLQMNNFSINVNWRDPNLRRTLTRGEVGCILSHYFGIIFIYNLLFKF